MKAPYCLVGLPFDGLIYGRSEIPKGQTTEHLMRQGVASQSYPDYFREISRNHSIPVMDNETGLFLSKIPPNGIICDVGGCWGWHWRNISHLRPDVKVIIVDFVRENFIHARNVLGNLVNKNIFLVHGDALSLPFPDQSFDGYWSVQTLQHIPDFERAIKEACRVLKVGGEFANYSLNNAPIIRLIYKILGHDYHVKGYIKDSFYLERASSEQFKTIALYFKSPIAVRFHEILFKPELRFVLPGRPSVTGKIDALLSGSFKLRQFLARQQSFHTSKKLVTEYTI